MISFGLFKTFGAGLLILGFGYLLSKLRIFSVLCLPAAVLGGVFALSVLVLFSHFFELKISFDESLKESFLLAFFASLGLGFSIDFSKKSNFSKNFFVFLGLCAFIMVLQNLLGITIISLFDKQKELGVIAGSISLSGSFGMGAFWSEVLKTEPHNITNALDISIACATFGALFGSVLGAPLGAFLIEKFVLKKENSRPQSKEKSPSQKELGNELGNALALFFSKKELKNTIISVLLLAFCVFCASVIKLFISLPAIIFALIFALMLRVLCYFFGINLAHKNLALLGNFCLALFLALALMSIDLKALLDIGLPLFVLL